MEKRYKIGDKVNITGWGHSYSSYSEWVRTYCSEEQKEIWLYGARPKIGLTPGIIVGKGKTLDVLKRMLYLVKVKNEDRVFIMNSLGLELVPRAKKTKIKKRSVTMKVVSDKIICDECGKEVEETYETVYGQSLCNNCLDEGAYSLCDICGKYDYSVIDVDRDIVCHNCLEEKYVQCEECGKWIIKDEATLINDGYHCNMCVDDYFTQCGDCGEYAADCNIKKVYDENGNYRTVCKDCADDYDTCDACGRLLEKDNREMDASGTIICKRCFFHYHHRCRECGDIVLNDSAIVINDEYYCQNCGESKMENFKGVHEYAFEPGNLLFLKSENDNPNEKLFAGIELEIDDAGEDNDNAERVTEIADNQIYCKHDGSIRNGFEIVTHPATIDYHLHNFPWEQICKEAIKLGYHSHNTTTCGLHLHLSRAGLGKDEMEQDLTIAKLLLFFESNWGDLVRFSRRTPQALNDWAKRYGKRDDETAWQLLDRAKGSGRYFAVNLKKEATVEFRMFKGTLKYETLIATIQLIDVIQRICKITSIDEMHNMTFVTINNVAKELGYTQLEHEMIKRKCNIVNRQDLGEVAATFTGCDNTEDSLDEENWEVGNTVRIINPTLSFVPNTYDGMIGHIVGIDSDEDGLNYRVEFSNGSIWSFSKNCLTTQLF